MKSVIVCNGTVRDYDALKTFFDNADYIISVDGGAAHLRKMDIAPHILIGDFDSADKADIRYFIERGIEAYQFPAEKDMTDSELAIEKAVENGADEIVLIAATGSRLDHSLSNVFLLKNLMDKGIKACIADEHNRIYMFNRTFSMAGIKGYKLSLIPVSEKVTGVSTQGLKYRLENATMTLGTSWGVSNEFLEDYATVEIGEGILLVCLSRD